MFGLSDRYLQQGYIVTISKKENKIQGSYIKKFSDGLHPYELPPEELMTIQTFPNIDERLSQGCILQVSMPTLLLCGIIGEERTEGPYCENKCLDVKEQVYETNFYRILSSLDTKLSLHDDFSIHKQYKKIYKGESEYE